MASPASGWSASNYWLASRLEIVGWGPNRHASRARCPRAGANRRRATASAA